ncbi:aminopeptidase N [Corynebacterium pseudotuberculosis]|uniref:Aminopeptidase N n=1 Tax=Corynebacterium pseudotuberculosis 258 TaxID=1168865 RepID=A0AAU8PNF1_CORPS|nr:aminopeptidase N [Corynebacterium pseudotuberculosis]AEQ07139.1 aminopeptidase N [Corynebacterium pseudotuberculosis CIP 52.97]AFB72948.1 aminopeptidase N [Corynebacterium pseudotuberculosis 316]AFK17236.1 aminopeptidase N [Corynebacterium pseudotuberculosis 258]AKS13931.1 Aminopeptidase N [Corynebacterium pseudotuberculosis]AMN70476.1 aminopeptidase N [Corynebacterium pseudotuberculosis]
MSSINLTQAEAEQRSRILDVHHYDIALDLTQGDKEFPSTNTVSFTVKEAGDTFIDLRAASVAEVLLDGVDITSTAVSLTSAGYDENQGLALRGLTPGQHSLSVTASCLYSHTGQGLHRFIDPEDQRVYLYTQCETADAKRIFACFDQPDLKATYAFTITAPKAWKVITNAYAEVTAVGDKAIHTSHVDYKLSTYLVALCAGDYHEVSDTWSGALTHHPETPADQPTTLDIPMSIYCRKSLAPHLDADTLFRETKQGFTFYHENFGMAYPFHKYDQIFVPEFNMGAMENAGAVTFRDEYVFSSKVTAYRYERRCDTVLHEMAHMWFGDLVTMKWWGDLWLNESFATWAAAISQAEATEYSTAWVTFANVEKSWAYHQDQLPSTHPITADASDIETVEQNFDGITYAKGSSVLKQLQAFVGREAFLAGVRKHFANHAFANATFDDLLKAFEEASGRDLSQWADQWLKTTGINKLSPVFTVTDGVYSEFAVQQSGAAPGAGELRTHRIAVGLYSLVHGRVERTHRFEIDIDGAYTPVPDALGLEQADLILVNDDDLTYCLMQLDPHSLDFIIHNIDKISDPMARTLCWSAAWEMTRDGKMRARDFVTLVARGAQFETEIAVLERILSQAAKAVRSYVDTAWADNTGHAMLANALLEGAYNAQPGSDAQLAFVQALAKIRITKDAATEFAAIVSGDSSLPGLTVDSDLRWWALTALIAHGDITGVAVRESVEKLRSMDHSSASELAALRAYAAQPNAKAKEEVFAEVTDTKNTLSNLFLRHKLEGLTFAGSGPYLTQFNSAIFALAEKIWAEMSSEVALATLSGIYPHWDVSAQGIENAREFLSKQSLPAGVRRVISEGMSEQERALQLREVDAH